MKRFRQPVAALFTLFALLGLTDTAQAGLSTDLQALSTRATELETYLHGVTLSTDELCGPLNQANALTRDLVNGIASVEGSLAAPLSTDAAIYDALDELFAKNLSIANEALRLSVDVQNLAGTAEMLTIKDGIAAMLQLSSDIGTMADRIGQTADKILVMSDDIGTMADRILITQQLQSENVALTTESILKTQTNVLTLVSLVEDSSYDLQLANLITEGGLLAARMETVMLSPWSMGWQLQSVASDVRAFLGEVQTLHDTVAGDNRANTAYVSHDALIQLGNLSLMLTSLATAVDGYVIAIEGLQAITSTPTLRDALGSMLQLSGDIGLMANRVLEIADQILVMSDNIGLQADQILLTQEAMNLNVVATQTSILGAQEMAVGLIAARDL